MKNLLNECKLEEALQLVNNIEMRENLPPEETLKAQAYKGWIHAHLGDFKISLEIAEELYQKSQELDMPLFTLDALSMKQWGFYSLLNLEEWHKNFELSVRLFSSIPREDSPEFQERKAQILGWKTLANYLEGNFDLAIDYGNKSLKLIEQVVPHHFIIPNILFIMAHAYYIKGELNHALEWGEKVLSHIPNEEYYSPMMLRSGVYYNIGVCYLGKGDLSTALEYLIKALEINKKLKKIQGTTGWVYVVIIQVLILQDNYDRAKNYLQQFKQHNEEEDSWFGHLMYKLSHALILKSSSRLHDSVEAENILKKIIKENKRWDVTNVASKHLCNWYFEEFRISHQMEILDDIQPLIDQLQRNARDHNSNSLLANVKLLQAKLALLQVSMVEARKLLTEAQQIADENGLQLLAGEISREHDHLLEKLKLWESFQQEQASVAERLKLASIDGVLERLQGRRAIEPLEATDEQPILLLILAEGGVLLFSYPFSNQWKRDDDLFGSFLSAFSTFTDDFFSKGLDRVKFGDDTILLQSVGMFSICYLFQGQTYFAKEKLEKFAETIQEDPSIWDTLEKFKKSSQVAELKDLPEMENLLTEVFLS